MNKVGKLNAAIYRNLQSILNSKLEDLSVRGGQHDYLYVISQREGITQRELSEELYVDKSTTAKAVKSLVSRGYVAKTAHPEDGRYVQLYLTEKGREIKPLLESAFSELVEIATCGLSDEEAGQTVILLNRILDSLLKERAGLDLSCK